MAFGRTVGYDMSVVISGIEKHSPAAKADIHPGDRLVSINGNEIIDVLDYRFYMMEKKLKLILDSGGREKAVVVRKKDEYDDLGLLFDTYLMDKQRSCRNQCVFCFIDQMPPGMRETLYFKDDDARMSFLYGNYITLTNLSEHDIERTIKMKISPINVSVHTTNPELRCKMMHNRFAGDALKTLWRFAEAGISLNTQLVLCPGLNDGPELVRSLNDLKTLGDSLLTVSCVPVGLTKFREGLFPLQPYTKEEAGKTIDLIDQFADEQFEKTGDRLFYSADEFYIKAERPIPDAAFYGDFNQLENGVGVIALQRQQFMEAMEEFEADEEERNLTVATGVAAAPFIQKLVDEARKKWHNLNCKVVTVKNYFFGEGITVAGLITGKDLIQQVKDEAIGDKILIPTEMLRYQGDLFLDDISLEEAQEALGKPLVPVEADGYQVLRNLLGKEY